MASFEEIPNLVMGVSQQPAPVRRASEVEEMVNCIPDNTAELFWRPPTKFIKKLSAGDYTDAAIHFINRDLSEQYVVVATDSTIKVFELDGTEKTVNAPAGYSYLAGTIPYEDLRLLTIADYTFVVNRAKVVSMAPDVTAAGVSAGLVVVKSAVYPCTYKVIINGTTYSYASIATDNTTTIATALAAAIGTAGGTMTVTRNNYVLKLESVGNAAFSLSIEDGRAGTAMTSILNEIQRFADLPTTAPKDYVVHVKGDPTTNFDDYYVKFVTNDGGTFNEGYWLETVKPNTVYKLDNTTMPHTLVRESDGTFTFAPATWGNRISGDIDSAPNPSFVGQRIQSLFLFKNRLGLLALQNIIMSRAGEFFEFFPETVSQILDSDPIDVEASSTSVPILRHAAPVDDQLILFSDNEQMVLKGGDVLSSKTVSITASSTYTVDLNCQPVTLKSDIFFTSSDDYYTRVYDYFTSQDGVTKDAADITANIPRYIVAPPRDLAVCPANNTILLLPLTNRNHLYYYRFLNSQSQSGVNIKAQSAWSRWEFPEGYSIEGMFFYKTDLFLVIQAGDGLFLEKITLADKVTDPNEDYIIQLDRRLTEDDVTTSYGSPNTTITLPYELPLGVLPMVVTRASDSVGSGRLPVVSSGENLDEVILEGDWTERDFYIGLEVPCYFTLSTLYIRSQTASGGAIATTKGRTQVVNLNLTYVSTTGFDVELSIAGRETKTRSHRGRIIGTIDDIIGTIPVLDGTITVPINSQNTNIGITVRNSAPFPARFTSAAWSYNYYDNHSNSRR